MNFRLSKKTTTHTPWKTEIAAASADIARGSFVSVGEGLPLGVCCGPNRAGWFLFLIENSQLAFYAKLYVHIYVCVFFPQDSASI